MNHRHAGFSDRKQCQARINTSEQKKNLPLPEADSSFFLNWTPFSDISRLIVRMHVHLLVCERQRMLGERLLDGFVETEVNGPVIA